MLYVTGFPGVFKAVRLVIRDLDYVNAPKPYRVCLSVPGDTWSAARPCGFACVNAWRLASLMPLLTLACDDGQLRNYANTNVLTKFSF